MQNTQFLPFYRPEDRLHRAIRRTHPEPSPELCISLKGDELFLKDSEGLFSLTVSCNAICRMFYSCSAGCVVSLRYFVEVKIHITLFRWNFSNRNSNLFVLFSVFYIFFSPVLAEMYF